MEIWYRDLSQEKSDDSVPGPESIGLIFLQEYIMPAFTICASFSLMLYFIESFKKIMNLHITKFYGFS